MGFSIDYEFAAGGPRPSSQYVWVIQGGELAEPWETPVELKGRGTLQTFVADLRPRQGPFESFIAEIRPDGSRRPASPVEPLKADAW